MAACWVADEADTAVGLVVGFAVALGPTHAARKEDGVGQGDAVGVRVGVRVAVEEEMVKATVVERVEQEEVDVALATMVVVTATVPVWM